MSNSVVTEANTATEEVKNALLAKYAELQSAHVQLGWPALVFAIALVASLGGGGYYTLQSFDRRLDAATAQETELRATNLQLQQQISANTVLMSKISEGQDRIVQTMAARDTATDVQIDDVRKKITTPQIAATAAQTELGTHPVVQGDKVCFAPAEVADFIATRYDRDRLAKDLGDTKDLYAEEQQKNALMVIDLAKLQGIVANDEKMLTNYKNLAKKSKWQKFLDGAEKAGLFVGGIALGHVI